MRLQAVDQRLPIDVVLTDAPSRVGGEGRVCDVAGRPRVVAKLYKDLANVPVDKLRAMIDNPPQVASADPDVPTIAWPLDLLVNPAERGRCVGFLMPKLIHSDTLYRYSNPVLRGKLPRQIDINGLYAIAFNLAVAFAAAHEKGYVIGDVNEENALVNADSLVTIIDADSFQVVDRRRNPVRIYRCTKDRDGFRAPERLGKDPHRHTRTVEEDLFGLGVLVYKLLRNGVHPFDGRYTGSGPDPGLEGRIERGLFPHTGRHPAQPRDKVVRLSELPVDIQRLVIRCFEDGHQDPRARPTALEWARALD